MSEKLYRLVGFHDDKPSEIMLLDGMEMPKGWASISQGRPTLEGLIRDLEIKTCPICGNLYSNKGYSVPASPCFRCQFWSAREAQSLLDGSVISGGHFYSIDPDESAPARYRGHGGRKFKIVRNGVEVITTNLWASGKIPAVWRERIPDNATITEL